MSLTANEHHHEDLFWALRGGGGNFGVVTSFEFRLSPVKDVYGGPIFFDLDRARDVLQFFREFIVDAPEQLGRLPGVPGRATAAVPARGAARRPAGRRSWPAGRDRSRRARGRPAVPRRGPDRRRAWSAPMPYPALNSAFDALVPPGLQHYWKANFNTELTDDAIEGHLQHAPGLPVRELDGAHLPDQRRVPPGRRRTTPPSPTGTPPSPPSSPACGPTRPRTTRTSQWVRDYYEATAPYSESGGYVNFMSGDDQDRVAEQLPRELRPPGRGQAGLRPRQPLPRQPEHRSLRAPRTAVGASGRVAFGAPPRTVLADGSPAVPTGSRIEQHRRRRWTSTHQRRWRHAGAHRRARERPGR